MRSTYIVRVTTTNTERMVDQTYSGTIYYGADGAVAVELDSLRGKGYRNKRSALKALAAYTRRAAEITARGWRKQTAALIIH